MYEGVGWKIKLMMQTNFLKEEKHYLKNFSIQPFLIKDKEMLSGVGSVNLCHRKSFNKNCFKPLIHYRDIVRILGMKFMFGKRTKRFIM